jgi:hypothetical protein
MGGRPAGRVAGGGPGHILAFSRMNSGGFYGHRDTGLVATVVAVDVDDALVVVLEGPVLPRVVECDVADDGLRTESSTFTVNVASLKKQLPLAFASMYWVPPPDGSDNTFARSRISVPLPGPRPDDISPRITARSRANYTKRRACRVMSRCRARAGPGTAPRSARSAHSSRMRCGRTGQIARPAERLT